jgi:hypothetical protein
LPLDLTRKINTADWIGERIFFSGWIRDGAKRGNYWYISDPREVRPLFTRLRITGHLRDSTPLTVRISNVSDKNIFIGTYCLKSDPMFGGCYYAGVALLNTDVPMLKEVFTKWINKGHLCVSVKDGKLYIKEIPSSVLNAELEKHRKPGLSFARGEDSVVDFCHPKHGLDFSSDKNKLTIIQFDRIEWN